MEISKLSSVLDDDGISDLLNDFFYSCINEICGGCGPTFQQFAKIDWTEDEYSYMHTLIRNLFSNSGALNYLLDETKVPQEITNFPDRIQIQILNCLKEKQECLVDVLMKKHSKKFPTVIDFDWRLKVIMGSSKVATLREPLMQLDLRIMENETENILNLEMNKNELDCLIKTLESAI